MLTKTRVQFLAFFLALALVGGASFAGGVAYNQQYLQPAVLPTLAAPSMGAPTLAAPTTVPAPTGTAAAEQPAPTTAPAASLPAGAPAEFQRLVEAYNTIQKYYVDRPAIQDPALVDGAISGMVDALGDTGHSRFLTPEELKNETTSMNGSFEGIGAYVDNKNGHNVIVAPMPDSPAERAGVVSGDIILKVDGEDVDGLPLQQVIRKILGPAGTQVKITFGNPTTGKTRDVTITRARIVVQNVTWGMIPGTKIADVHIASFSQGVTDQLREALTTIQSQGATGLILDLRNDPGGLLNEAIGVASQFLKSGVVMQEKDAQGNLRPSPVRRGGLATDIPLVVLINGGTASAPEIVSGAIQDAGRAFLIGQKTFGTGTVLNIFPLANESAMMLATGEWLTPKGRSLWHQGVSPDQEVVLESTVSLLQPGTLKNLTAAQVLANPDLQLLKALELLQTGKFTPAATP